MRISAREGSVLDSPKALMPVEMLSSLKDLLKVGPELTNGEYSPLVSFLSLRPDSEFDRQVAGALYDNLSKTYARRLNRALASESLRYKQRIYREALKAYSDAAKKVDWEMASEKRRMISRGSGAHAIWQRVRLLQRWSVYGSEVATHVDEIKKLARARQMTTATQWAQVLGLPTNSPDVAVLAAMPIQPMRPGEITRRDKPSDGLVGIIRNSFHPYSPDTRLKLDDHLDKKMSELGLIKTEWDAGKDESRWQWPRFQNFHKVEHFINSIRFGELGLRPVLYEFEDWRRKFSGDSGRLLILRDGRGLVRATAAFSQYFHGGKPVPGVSHLEMVYMPAELRGKNGEANGNGQGAGQGKSGKPGLGRLLVLSMMREASLRGYDEMVLRTRYDSMWPATSLYMKLGFMPASKYIKIRLGRRTDNSSSDDAGVVYLGRSIRPSQLAEEFWSVFTPIRP